jgi:branched-chain amino acid transport system ATP-binding protein
MAKMLDVIKREWLAFRIRQLGAAIEFETGYLPLVKASLEEELKTKIDVLAWKRDKALLKHEIACGVSSASVDGAMQTARLQVEKEYYWKRLELLKKRSDAYRKNPDLAALDQRFAPLLLDFEAKRSAALEASMECFRPNPYRLDGGRLKTNRHATDVKLYQKVREAKEHVYQTKVASLQLKTEKAKNRLTGSSNQKQTAWQAKLALAKEAFVAYAGTNTTLESKIESTSILKLDSLSMHFGGLKAVDNLSFTVKRGEIFGLIGPNGAGKTTVFNCITRFYKATSGGLYYRNRMNEAIDLANIPVHNVIKTGIVRTFQNVEMVWELNVLENLLVAAHTRYKTGFFGQLLNTPKLRREEKVMRQKAQDVLADLGLTNYAYFYPFGLPYGILKKVELARTLMGNPDLIILDEPAAGLNDAETESLKQTIRKIRDDYHATIFLVEHDMGLVMDVCDTVCAISFGKLLAIGTPSQIQQNKMVREAYLGGE